MRTDAHSPLRINRCNQKYLYSYSGAVRGPYRGRELRGCNYLITTHKCISDHTNNCFQWKKWVTRWSHSLKLYKGSTYQRSPQCLQAQFLWLWSSGRTSYPDGTPCPSLASYSLRASMAFSALRSWDGENQMWKKQTVSTCKFSIWIWDGTFY